MGHGAVGGDAARLDVASRGGVAAAGPGAGRGEGVAAASRRCRDGGGGPEQAGDAAVAGDAACAFRVAEVGRGGE
ncbi:hypothetical protein [Streptomyces sp. F001]|uniref:hypothetical protein n=1 Tax=Streptomyces sp. F001 TaxID=1510026 RepID=UPI00320B4CEF